MPKLKTRKAAAKRLKRSGTGKLVRRQSFRSHLLTKKRPRRKRALSQAALVSAADKKAAQRMAPYVD